MVCGPVAMVRRSVLVVRSPMRVMCPAVVAVVVHAVCAMRSQRVAVCCLAALLRQMLCVPVGEPRMALVVQR